MRRGLSPWRTMSPHRSRKYRSPLNAWNVSAFPSSPLPALLFLGIQQLEGNFLTPKIQGDTLHVHPILVFLAVIIGGGLGGIPGVIVSVPTLAVLRVLFDFFRVRLKAAG
jgi:predicted PurR-regulated permease PerM